jgi:TRAP-type uncharacterized transport system substrate-binding protein
MKPTNPLARLPALWRGKAIARAVFLLVAAAAIAGVAAAFGIARDYGYLQASILTGSPGGQYHALAARLAERARREHGTLTVISTAGSIENVSRLASNARRCSDMFALVQDGTPVPAEAKLELLGRLPTPETLLVLGRAGRVFHALPDFRGASVGIGPQGSGTAYLMRQLLSDTDLRDLDIRLSNHELTEQARLVAEGKLDLVAFVMQEDAEFLHTIIRQYDLDIVAPQVLQGLIARYPWLSVGHIPAGFYDLARPIPATDKQVVRLRTLLIASPCAQRADRIAMLMLAAAELPNFVRDNPPRATAPPSVLPLAREARQFFLTGEPELADRYFPWLVNLMSPAYWVYLVMAVTVLFNVMRGYSKFRLWRIDATREKLEAAVKRLVDPAFTHAQMRAAPAEQVLASPQRRAVAQSLMEQLRTLRTRCQRQTNSFVTPMGDEIYYRYQQVLIDEAATTLAALLDRTGPARREARSANPAEQTAAAAPRKEESAHTDSA